MQSKKRSPAKLLETLRRNWEFQQVFRVGKSIPGREIVLYGMRTRRKHARFGFNVSKKVGCAVVRNRLRRRLREICRLFLGEIRTGWDLVLVARSDAAERDFWSLRQAFQQQAQRLGCWSEQAQPAGKT
ncbi:ribonuclease P protein component [bacterium]|nr:ribonuclease P protein component [bacterium]